MTTTYEQYSPEGYPVSSVEVDIAAFLEFRFSVVFTGLHFMIINVVPLNTIIKYFFILYLCLSDV